MNKKEFIEILREKAKLSLEDAGKVNEILEDNFFISASNKEKIIDKIVCTLEVDRVEAEEVYDISIDIIKTEIKEKLKHPFRDKN